jgi:hypothetical protein
VTGIRDAALGVWDFVVGDDWVTAAGVVLALGLTAVVDEGGSAWLVTPVAVVALLALSIWRETRKRQTRGPSERRTTMSRP